MIDIHCHMLPGVDDGSSSLEESIKLLKEASEEGISSIILTPHYMYHGRYHKSKAELYSDFSLLKEELNKNNIPLNLYLGNETLCFKEISDYYENDTIASLANSNYVLVEFEFLNYEKEYDEYLYELSLAKKIIIAHPERYKYVIDDVYFVNRWLKEGYYLQVNADSITNKKNPSNKVANELLELDYVSFVASDAHSENRPVKLLNAYEMIAKKYSEEKAEELFKENQNLLLENKEIKHKAVKEKQKFFKRLFK